MSEKSSLFCILSVFLASLLWGIMFSPWTAGQVNFWIMMSVSVSVLSLLAVYWGTAWRQQFVFSFKEIAIGMISAFLLWVLFYIGRHISAFLFDFTTPQVSAIYAIRSDHDPLLLAGLLLFLIGPAEEIFWRGYIQRSLGVYCGSLSWLLCSFLYALVHIWALNFILFMAALICGIFWGALYQWRKNLTAVIVSHGLWDVAVFIYFPVL